MEWEINRSRDEMEKEIERQFKAKQLSDSLNAHQQRFDEVTKRLEEEERIRFVPFVICYISYLFIIAI